MPELPEVENARQVVEKALDRTIAHVDDADEYVCRPHHPGEIDRALKGGRLVAAHRRGKTMWCDTVTADGDEGPRLGIHLGMGGRIVVTGPSGDANSVYAGGAPHVGEWVGGERSDGGSAGGERSDGGSAGGERSDGGSAAGERSDGGSAAGERSDGGSAAGERSDGDSVGGERSDGGSAGGERSDGDWIRAEPPATRPGAKAEWDRVTITFDDGGSLRLFDKRRLGRVRLEPDVDALGPDAADITRDEFRARVGRGVLAIKAKLLDQSVLAGVGNLLADETLWQARLRPTRRAGELSTAELDDLRRVLRRATRAATAKGGVHTGDVIPYRRKDATCPRCGAPMERGVVGGRTTWWCSAEQAG